jgi:hypothetical protein
MSITVSNYPGRVWTCDAHNALIEGFISQGMIKTAQGWIRSVHPKKGNICKECARLWEDTPAMNR